jgi:hypothetical protein
LLALAHAQVNVRAGELIDVKLLSGKVPKWLVRVLVLFKVSSRDVYEIPKVVHVP